MYSRVGIPDIHVVVRKGKKGKKWGLVGERLAQGDSVKELRADRLWRRAELIDLTIAAIAILFKQEAEKIACPPGLLSTVKALPSLAEYEQSSFQI